MRHIRRTRTARGATLLAGALVFVTAGVVSTSGAATPAPHAAHATRSVAVTVRSSRYGRILFDGRGRALYLFTRDRGNHSSCSGACAQAWPPFLSKGSPKAGDGLHAALLGTTRRSDRTVQVTYAGHPLYYYSGDTKPGQIKCQGVSNFGGLWLVVSETGRAVR